MLLIGWTHILKAAPDRMCVYEFDSQLKRVGRPSVARIPEPGTSRGVGGVVPH